MYNQVKVPPVDRDALRFLWTSNGEVRHYRMTSHLFGGEWCASSATYALQQCATVTDNALIKDVILNSFYVDDCLVSLKTANDVKTVIVDLKSTLQARGFKLTKYIVNDRSLMQLVPDGDRSSEPSTIFSCDSDNKVLGVRWNVDTDSFHYQLHLDMSQSTYTKAQLLSIVASIYDPLGLVSPVTVVGMMLFQEASRLKINWKQQLPDVLIGKWREWLMNLDDLPMLKIPRCMKPNQYDDSNTELHLFSDASAKSYGACSYLRCVNRFGGVHVALVCSKSRLAPIKCVTIPRLELQAAHLSVVMETTLREELSDIQLTKSYFWIDSEIVLAYIKNTTSRFHVFVANRLSVIHQSSNQSQWHHIPGKDNPADLLTRGTTPSKLGALWFEGPPFLATHKSGWPATGNAKDVPRSDPEVKTSIISHNVATDKNKDNPIDQLIHHFSSWDRLMRAIAWISKVKDRLMNRDVHPMITSGDLQRAEIIVISHVQHHCYHREATYLHQHRALPNSFNLRKLSPQINEDNILVVGSRLKHANINNRSLEPYIVPYDSKVAVLIAREIHCIAHHGIEWTLIDIRQKYWITRGRVIVKRVIRACIACKRLFSPPATQKMSDLPPERVSMGKPPFSYSGVDCFGPYHVKVGRSEVARYGCVFTCFNTRAVHIEKLNNLEADSFLNGLRRFIARRGLPEKIFSDNGTHFVGANNQMRKAYQETVNSFFARHKIEWKFNPPRSSHMGGVWERMIRTIRKVFDGILERPCRLSDETLETLFCEVEAIVNGRPLKKVSDDVNDAAPLTPNHLLILRGNPNTPLGRLLCNDIYRARWRHVQYLANLFWKRWMKEYLPLLHKRSKWLVKTKNFVKGDLVLLLDENTPRALWPLGLVIDTNVGRDGLVRSVRLKTKSTELVRPITKLVHLESFGTIAVEPAVELQHP